MNYIKQFSLFKVLSILLILSSLVIPSSLVFAAETTTVSVVVQSEVETGEQFTIRIEVEPATAIAGIQFDLSFDQSLVTANSVTEDNLLSQGGAATYFNSGEINNTTGTISSVAGTIIAPGQTISIEGTFATITFTAGTDSGTCPFTLSGVIVGDVNGQSLPINVVSGEIAINGSPVLDAIGNRSINERQTITFTVSATDPDEDTLSYTVTDLPDGATFNTLNKTFFWTPRYDQAGIYQVQFTVSDGTQTDTEDVTITVVQIYNDWDVNGDDSSNVLDMILVGQHWGETGLTGWIQADVNEDGSINVLDMIVIGQHWTG